MRREPICKQSKERFYSEGRWAGANARKGADVYLSHGVNPADVRAGWFRMYPQRPVVIDDRLRAEFRRGYRDGYKAEEKA